MTKHAETLRIRPHVEWRDTEREPGVAGPSRGDADFEARRALVVHVVADEHDRLRVAFARELLDGTAHHEYLALPFDVIDVERSTAVEWARSHRPDVPVGIPGELAVLSVEELGQLICLRCYRANVALVAWDLPWTLGRLAAYTGRARNGGFTIALYGTGVYKDGEWRDSFKYPRLVVTPRDASQSGAFLQWGRTVLEGCRPKAERHRFIDLKVLAEASHGGEVRALVDAIALLDENRP
jgi:hypothetical protein